MIFDETRPVLITGGAGFIGTNLADRLLRAGQPVLVYDSLARKGSEDNLRWLRRKHGPRLEIVVGDVRDEATVRAAVRRACRVFHFAAQVAVTTSLVDPRHDFDVNAGGTLNLLEAIREAPARPPLLFTSTNKVYGTLRDVELAQVGERYAPVAAELRARGLGENQPLDFHSPYGCSKGTADQYVLDYARVYGLPAVVFRMSCIYGPHQRGNEDQGWVAHFLLQALAGRPITIFGDGRQVRDLLYVDDLMNAMLAAHANIARLSGCAFNMGGGIDNAVSLREVIDIMTRTMGEAPTLGWQDWRAADQRYYVSDVGRFSRATGWRPEVSVTEGIGRLLDWCKARRNETAAARIAEAAWLAEAARDGQREPVREQGQDDLREPLWDGGMSAGSRW
jgi:CDP-paratose 2-epimerase